MNTSNPPLTAPNKTVKKYVLGFLFDGYGRVWLIIKNRPDWQKGLINGIGGKIESGETPTDAMEREFREETGCAEKLNWRQYGIEHNENFELNLFTAESSTADIDSITDEEVIRCLVADLPENIIPNLSWMIPMANYKEAIFADIKAVSERA